jgi:hypothetical protein
MTVTQLLSFTVVNVVDNEVPVGAIDGKNTTFTAANAPNPPSSLYVHVNGLLLHAATPGAPAADFSLAGAQIQLTSYVPQVGDTILVSYRH